MKKNAIDRIVSSWTLFVANFQQKKTLYSVVRILKNKRTKNERPCTYSVSNKNADLWGMHLEANGKAWNYIQNSALGSKNKMMGIAPIGMYFSLILMFLRELCSFPL